MSDEAMNRPPQPTAEYRSDVCRTFDIYVLSRCIYGVGVGGLNEESLFSSVIADAH